MRLASLGALLCALVSASCASASPVAQSAPAPEERSSKERSFVPSEIELFLRSAEGLGYQMARVAVPLSEIPSVTVPPMLDVDDVKALSPDAPRFHVSDLAFTEGRERSWSCPAHGAERNKLCAACMNPKRWRTVRAEGPVRGSAAHHELSYELIDGVRDPIAPQVIVQVRKTRVIAKEVLPGFLYAFRFFDPDMPGIELVSFILPPAIDLQVSKSAPTDSSGDARSGFSRVTLPLRQGASESVRALVMSAVASAWTARLFQRAERPPTDNLTFGIELSHAGYEAEPRLVAYVSRFNPLDR